MTDESAPSRAPGHRDPADRNGVRTYRGRTVEELIPRIRAELGPDAIILREREGLTGGIGGFFAQRCVEIDAQAAPRLSVYDDDFDEDDEEYGEYAEYDEDDVDDERAEPEAVTPPARAVDPPPPARAEVPPPPPARAEVPPPPPAPEAAAPPPSTAAHPPRPASSFLDEASFAARLEEATFAADDVPAPGPPSRPAPSAAPPLFIAFDELGEDPETPPAETPPPTLQQVIDLADIEHTEPTPPPAVRREPPEPAPAVSPEPTPEPAAETAPSPRPTATPRSRLQPPPDELAPDPKAPWMAFAAEAQMPNGSSVWRPPAPPAASAAPPPFAPPPAPQPEPSQSEPSPAQPPQGPPAAPYPATPPAPYGAAPGSPAPTPPAPESPTWPSPAGTPNPGWPTAPGYGARRRSGLLPAAERMLRAALEATAAANERRNLELQARAFPGAPPIPGQAQPPIPGQPQPQIQPPAAAPAPSPAVPAPNPTPAVKSQPAAPPTPAVDAEAQRRQEQRRREADLERRLTRAGISSHRAAALVAGALSRRGPATAEGELADEIRRALVAALPMPHTLPKDSAIAIVGAGGSGKTRCVAALASAYSGAGVDVSVASFGGPTREDELGELLHGESVNVIPAMRTRATARAVSSAREHSLVIIDTASATPGDDSTIDMIAEALHSFRLDAIYLAVPATLSLPAALKLVDSFSAFDLAGMVATHVDETDQLGMIAELSMQTGIPVVYTHTGLHLQTAIASADAEAIATSVL
ncbi:MAG TPA: hypothetical protein VFN87_05115 [Solirubrobacteraceae bacterium]|nr:hypothetical protein [Solirubrobacteraceae bacterium]